MTLTYSYLRPEGTTCEQLMNSLSLRPRQRMERRGLKYTNKYAVHEIKSLYKKYTTVQVDCIDFKQDTGAC